jgi:HK97 gp10 family phage protein
MRIEGWHAKEIFSQIAEEAIKAANGVMDDVVVSAKAKCPIGSITREGKFASANISFTPKTGANKGKLVSFSTDKRWMGRNPGDLRNSIRRVNRRARPGNIRVMAGNFKTYWAFMVEYGTAKSRPQPFLRPAFQGIKNSVISRIEAGIAKVPEVVK